MSKNTKNQTPVNEVVETKVVTPKFDRVSFVQDFKKKFECDTRVDLVIDTELDGGCRATNQPDYRYVHIFKKGTTKNCFQLYVDSTDCKFVVGKNISELIPDSELFTKKPVIKREKVAYIIFNTPHDNAEVVLQLLLDTYTSSLAAREVAKVEAEAKRKEEKKVKQEEKAKKAKKPSTKKEANPA